MAFNSNVVTYLKGIYETLAGGGEDVAATFQTQKFKWTKEGEVFETSKYLTISSGASAYATLEAGDTDLVLMNRLISFDEEGVSINIYRNAITSGGTDESDNIFNTNDKSPKASGATFTTGVTVSDVGEQSAATKWCITGDASSAGGGFYETVLSEQIIEAGSSVLLSVTNLDADTQDVAIHLVWAEVDV